MNRYLSHTVGLKARLLALYFTVLSQTSDKAVSTYRSRDQRRKWRFPEDESQQEKTEYVKRVNKEKM